MLLIDEIDKSDQEFEAFLLEILSDYQVTIPEIGSVHAVETPIVLLTSNSTRDLGDALKRRCLHLHIGFPDAKLEGRIIELRVPGIETSLRRELVAFVQQLRTLDLKKVPSVSETIDWARVLVLLHAAALDTELVHDTLNVLLKFEADIEVANKQIATLTQKAQAGGRASGMSAVPLPPTPSRKGRGSAYLNSPSPCGRGLGGGGRRSLPNRSASSSRRLAAPVSVSPPRKASTRRVRCGWWATQTARA